MNALQKIDRNERKIAKAITAIDKFLKKNNLVLSSDKNGMTMRSAVTNEKPELKIEFLPF